MLFECNLSKANTVEGHMWWHYAHLQTEATDVSTFLSCCLQTSAGELKEKVFLDTEAAKSNTSTGLRVFNPKGLFIS